MFGNWIADKFGEMIEAAIVMAIDFILWMFNLTWIIVQSLSAPNVGDDFVRLWAGRIFYISLPLLAIFFVVQITIAAVKRSPSHMGNAVVGLLVAVIGTIFSVPLVAYLTRGFDSLADGLITTAMGDVGDNLAAGIFGDLTGSEIYALFAALSLFNGANTFGTAVVLGLFFGGLILMMLIGTFALFLALLIRTNLLYIMVVIGPIMLAGIPWESTRPWARRWVSTVVALIFTKLGVVIVLAVGTGILTSSLTGMITKQDGEIYVMLDSVGMFLGSGLMLMLAAIAPVATFKFFDFLGESAVAGMHAEARGPVDAAKQQASKNLNPAALGGHTRTAAPVAAGPAGLAGGAAVAGGKMVADGAQQVVTDAHELPGQTPVTPGTQSTDAPATAAPVAHASPAVADTQPAPQASPGTNAPSPVADLQNPINYDTYPARPGGGPVALMPVSPSVPVHEPAPVSTVPEAPASTIRPQPAPPQPRAE